MLFAALAASQIVVHDWFIDSRVRSVQRALHEQVIASEAPAPIQYRVFVHYIAEGLMRAGLSFESSFGAIRFVFTFLAAWLFYVFLKTWFVTEASLIGVLWLFAVLPFTYIRYYFQPMDMPNLFFFVAGLIAARRKNFAGFLAILAVAMLNRETAILLAFVWLFTNWGERKNSAVAVETFVAGGVGMAVYAILRKIFTLKPYYSDLFYLNSNLSDLRTYLYAAIIFGPFIFYAFRDLPSKPAFLKRAALIIPFFVIIHYTMTIMIEPRLWLPMLPVIIALGLWSIVPKTMLMPDAETAPSNKNFSKRKNAGLYFALLAVFTVFFAGFFLWYEKAHLGDRRDHELSEKILTEASRLSGGGWDEAAVEQLKKGATLFPEKAEFHYRLALSYAYRIFDEKKALEHFRKTLELDPHHLDRERVMAEISRIEYHLKNKSADAAKDSR